MKVAVTGATGFIGRNLIQRLIETDYQVVALVRSSSKTDRFPTSIASREIDLFNKESLERAVEDIDIIIHLASYFDFFPKDEALMFQVNIEGTKNLMNACVGTSVSRFIYCSTTETIGPTDDSPIDEDAELNPHYSYGKSKVLAEEAIREITYSSGLPHIILRPTGVVGPLDMYVGYDIIEAINNQWAPIIPCGKNLINMFTYVDDAVDGFIAALDSEVALNQTIILSPDDVISWKNLYYGIADYLGAKRPRVGIPRFLGKIGIGLLSLYRGRGRKTFLWNSGSIVAACQHRWYSNEKAKRLLNWSPKYSVLEGFKATADWYLENGYLERRS